MSKKKSKSSEKSPTSLIKRILPFTGLTIIVAFCLGSIFFGFMSLKVDCNRPNAETLPNCKIEESRLFGLYSRSATIDNVSNVDYKTSVGNKSMLQSTLVLVGDNIEVPLSKVSSNYGSWKESVSSQIKSYLTNKSEVSLKIDYFDWNIFGLIGSAMFFIFSLSLLYYLKTLFSK
jgi:hypothetical protein